tara:strand:- start:169 stop:363 length:195 start_codon:yes stop_codon:yes gene_type:complete
MTRRTYEKDAQKIEVADDLDKIVKDERKNWRANSTKVRRRQRRYENRLTKELLDIENNQNEKFE